MHHPFLIGKKIYLRGIEEGDLSKEYFQWFNDIEICRHNSHATFPNSEKKMRDYFNDVQSGSHAVVFAIVEKRSNIHTGNISLQKIDWISRNAEIAFIMDKKFWGKGYGYEAGKLVIDYAFERLNLVRVYCGTSSKNIGMQKLAVKLGMNKEGVRKKAMYKLGEYSDIIEYGVLNNK
ncbi:MAG: GNAT family N-acetyltransferase [Candidatus Omnitrophica bacterium]|nr:GNAT family N-acetyltransferase [Candidatus Omnitrophota bacterium]